MTFHTEVVVVIGGNDCHSASSHVWVNMYTSRRSRNSAPILYEQITWMLRRRHLRSLKIDRPGKKRARYSTQTVLHIDHSMKYSRRNRKHSQSRSTLTSMRSPVCWNKLHQRFCPRQEKHCTIASNSVSVGKPKNRNHFYTFSKAES